MCPVDLAQRAWPLVPEAAAVRTGGRVVEVRLDTCRSRHRWAFSTPLVAVFPNEYVRPVPRISAFYGIVIAMYFDDHPPPHFHAKYGEHQAQIVIATGEVLHGELPRRALRLVREWTELHLHELVADWERAERDEPLVSIDPLP